MPTPARHLEVERKLDAPAGLVLPDLTGLPGVATVAEPAEQVLDATYFDTADLRLLGARLTLRRRTGGTDAGWHLKRPAGADARTEEHHPLGRATRTVPAPLRAAVQVHARGAVLEPVVRLRTGRTVRQLLDADGRVLAEVATDHVRASVPAAGSRWVRVAEWDEIEVELVGGRRKLLDATVAALVAAGASPSTSRSKLARAVAEAGRLPGAAPRTAVDGRVPAPRPPAAGTAGAVVRDYLRAQVDHLEAHDPLVRVDADDAVHQVRVACRRLRSALATFRPVLDRGITDPVRAELRWLGEALAAARDAEVVRDHLIALAGAEPPGLLQGPVVERITATMDEHYRAARAEALVDLDSPRYFALLDTLDALVARPPFAASGDAPAARVLLPLAVRTYRRTARLVEAAGRADDPHRRDLLLHEVRKAAKRARYTGESLTAAFGRDARRFARRMATLQEVLGEHQDSVVVRDRLVEIAAAARAAGESTFSYGRLHALEQQRGTRTEREFDVAWRRASEPGLRRWLR